jgi:acetyltransferase-like isoleucine patch superfamily enzyme
MRGSSFASSLNCPDVKVNDEYVGCLKQNGFIKVELEAGANKICFCRSALEVGDDTVINLNLSAGEVRFFEWKPEIGDMVFIGANVHATGGKMESIIEHSNETALPLLRGFKNSI